MFHVFFIICSLHVCYFLKYLFPFSFIEFYIHNCYDIWSFDMLHCNNNKKVLYYFSFSVVLWQYYYSQTVGWCFLRFYWSQFRQYLWKKQKIKTLNTAENGCMVILGKYFPIRTCTDGHGTEIIHSCIKCRDNSFLY